MEAPWILLRAEKTLQKGWRPKAVSQRQQIGPKYQKIKQILQTQKRSEFSGETRTWASVRVNSNLLRHRKKIIFSKSASWSGKIVRGRSRLANCPLQPKIKQVYGVFVKMRTSTSPTETKRKLPGTCTLPPTLKTKSRGNIWYQIIPKVWNCPKRARCCSWKPNQPK